MNIRHMQLVEIIYTVLREAQTRINYPSVVAGQLSQKETWIMDEIIRKCEETSQTPGLPIEQGTG